MRIIRKPDKNISKEMIGLFFEDINYAADGGLYAEMIENRSFEAKEAVGVSHNFYTMDDPLNRNGLLAEYLHFVKNI